MFIFVLNLFLRLPLCLLGLLGLWRTTQLPSQLSLQLGGGRGNLYENMDGAPFGRSTDIFLNFASNVTNTQTDKMRRDEGLISVERKGASVNDQNSTNTRKKKTC